MSETQPKKRLRKGKRGVDDVFSNPCLKDMITIYLELDDCVRCRCVNRAFQDYFVKNSIFRLGYDQIGFRATESRADGADIRQAVYMKHKNWKTYKDFSHFPWPSMPELKEVLESVSNVKELKLDNSRADKYFPPNPYAKEIYPALLKKMPNTLRTLSMSGIRDGRENLSEIFSLIGRFKHLKHVKISLCEGDRSGIEMFEYIYHSMARLKLETLQLTNIHEALDFSRFSIDSLVELQICHRQRWDRVQIEHQAKLDLNNFPNLKKLKIQSRSSFFRNDEPSIPIIGTGSVIEYTGPEIINNAELRSQIELYHFGSILYGAIPGLFINGMDSLKEITIEIAFFSIMQRRTFPIENHIMESLTSFARKGGIVTTTSIYGGVKLRSRLNMNRNIWEVQEIQYTKSGLDYKPSVREEWARFLRKLSQAETVFYKDPKDLAVIPKVEILKRYLPTRKCRQKNRG